MLLILVVETVSCATTCNCSRKHKRRNIGRCHCCAVLAPTPPNSIVVWINSCELVIFNKQRRWFTFKNLMVTCAWTVLRACFKSLNRWEQSRTVSSGANDSLVMLCWANDRWLWATLLGYQSVVLIRLLLLCDTRTYDSWLLHYSALLGCARVAALLVRPTCW